MILGFRLLSAVVSTIGVTGRLPLLLSGRTIVTQAKSIVVIFNAERVILSWVQVLAPMVLKPRPLPMPTRIGYSLRRGKGDL